VFQVKVNRVATRSRWRELGTEAINPRSRDIDLLEPDKIVEVMLLDNRSVFAAVLGQKAQIARGVELAAAAVLAGGRLIFAGAGTSGRLGVLEAAELPPTFGIDAARACAIMAGGAAAVLRAREGVEDDRDAGVRAMRALRPVGRDLVIAVSASGATPFVRGAVVRARAAKARILAVTCNARSELIDLADVAIVLAVGPEVVAGSTRLKAGTATKIALNTLTTAAMVRAGKTYGNLMVDVKSNSDKLRDRARRIVSSVTGLDDDASQVLLRRAKGDVKAAILMHNAGTTRTAALSQLRAEPRLRKLLGRQ
jgi:N-acetylmuramic acid 6-phosphate etherase